MAKGKASSSSKRRPPRRRRLFSHTRLVMAEAVLLVGALHAYLEETIEDSEALHPALKVGLLMIVVVGIYGSVILFFERLAQRSLEKTHKVVQALPLPTPFIVVHVLVLVAIYLLYATVFEVKLSWWPPWEGKAA